MGSTKPSAIGPMLIGWPARYAVYTAHAAQMYLTPPSSTKDARQATCLRTMQTIQTGLRSFKALQPMPGAWSGIGLHLPGEPVQETACGSTTGVIETHQQCRGTCHCCDVWRLGYACIHLDGRGIARGVEGYAQLSKSRLPGEF